MNQLAKITDTTATMTSREIAELVESRHDSVKRTIERLANQGVIVQPPLVDEPGTDSMGRPRATQAYCFSGEQGKRDSIIVVAQLSPEFTARLVDRWKALEEGTATPVFQIPTNLADALQLAADQARENQELQQRINADRPKVIALDRFSAADGSMNQTNTAKHLGVRPKDLTAFLSASRWIYRRAGGRSAWTGYQDKIQQGLLEHKPYISVGEDGTETMRQQVLITAKGIAKLAVLLSASPITKGESL